MGINWPWKKKESQEKKLAICFFVGAEQMVAELAKGHEGDIGSEAYYVTITEVVCSQLHLADRVLLDAAPNSRNERMDRLVSECVSFMPQGMYEHSSLPKPEVDQIARELLLSTYEKRQSEYESLREDWFRQVLVRSSKHFVEALEKPSLSSDLLMRAEIKTTAIHDVAVKNAPEFFKP